MERTMDVDVLDRAVIADGWTSDRTYQNLLVLCDEIGARFAGSEGEHQAADFLLQKLQEYGLQDVHAEEFSYIGWRRGAASLEILEPVGRSLSAIALPYSPPIDLVGEVVSVGQGEVEDFQRLGERLRDKIVLCLAESTPAPGKRASHRREKYMRAVEAGAVGFLYVSQNPGGLLVTGSLPAGLEKGPAGVAISKEDGATLLRLSERGAVKARLVVEGLAHPTFSRNVVGDIPGRGTGQQILVGAHYDSHDICVGALDNAAGTVVALEIARLLQPMRGELGVDLRFVLFASEEGGLRGSWDYVQRHLVEIEGLRFMLNLDTTGRGPLGAEALTLMGCPDLVPYFEGVMAAMKYPMPVNERPSGYSDHFPFVAAGVPTGALAANERADKLVGRGWGHTVADTVDKVHPPALQMSAVLGARLLLRLAQDEAWPGRHLTPDEVEKLLEANGLLEFARFGGRYPLKRRSTSS